ncbi:MULTISPECIES: transcriptional regulator [Cupriavidus]
MKDTTVFTSQELDTYFSSYVGMEGGNPGAAVWFCDSSPQRWTDPLRAPLLPRPVPPAWDAAFRAAHRDSMARWLSYQRIARIMAAARAEVLGRRLSEADWKPYFEQKLFGPDGAEFKLNLFPVPDQLDGIARWSTLFRGQPALLPKERYLDLCRFGGRFRFLARICACWQPKVVVCFGQRHAQDFIRAFGLGKAAADEWEEWRLQPADLVMSLRVFRGDGTTWIICPALAGANGLNSDVLLNAFGKLLAASLAPSDFGAVRGDTLGTPLGGTLETCAPPRGVPTDAGGHRCT